MAFEASARLRPCYGLPDDGFMSGTRLAGVLEDGSHDGLWRSEKKQVTEQAIAKMHSKGDIAKLVS